MASTHSETQSLEVRSLGVAGELARNHPADIEQVVHDAFEVSLLPLGTLHQARRLGIQRDDLRKRLDRPLIAESGFRISWNGFPRR
jgi:hypothetical protein